MQTWTLISQFGMASRRQTHSVWPPCAAQCNGVEPALSSPLTDIYAAHSKHPAIHCLELPNANTIFTPCREQYSSYRYV